MSRTGVVVDSTSDLPAGAAGLDIAVVPLVVSWDNQSYLDKVELSTTDFYRRLRSSKSLPRTGAPSPASFEQAFRRGLERFDGLVCVCLAAPLSGTYEIARQAAAAVAPDRVVVVDSGSVTMAAGWLAERAAHLGAAGESPTAIATALDELKPRLRIYAILDTLEFLQRGGRIGRARAIAGTLLHVKPIILVADGAVEPVERVRTLPAATRRLMEIVTGLGPLDRLAVLHGDAVEQAESLERQLQPHYPGLVIDQGEISSVVGIHGGPGLFGVAVLLAADGRGG